ncbi:MipA/OmpV family protein [Afifella pfennigii]|uniref:MipA/OmpV family protein n=1 Tax=Afifella pfennigii TaxID=209897 RepID=UPI00047CB035|nr:MipA/OmpV family protein [Afifella pfennigii]
MRLFLPVIAAALMTAQAAQAQDVPTTYGAGGEDLVLELGGGGSVAPAYEGADDYVIQPRPFFSLHYLRLPVIGDFGGKPEREFSFGPSFRVVRERDDNDYAALTGIGDVDTAVELGGKVRYRRNSLEAFLALRRGVTGHDGFVGETGLNVITRPLERLEFKAGPRLSFADGEYMQTYLGVTAAQAAASGLPFFDADGGVKGVGLSGEARYSLTQSWTLVGYGGYERLVGDAADSPITKAGSENQFTAALGLTYTFGLDLFD